MKRWIIRSFFIGLAAMCLGGWVVSYLGLHPLVGFARDNPNFQYMLQIDRGTLHFCHSAHCGWFPSGLFCRWDWDPPEIPKAFLGFYFTHDKDDFFHYSGIPLWLPSLMSLALLWLTWRKTRMHGAGFPVEVT